jgi:hypothetical protein
MVSPVCDGDGEAQREKEKGETEYLALISYFHNIT